MVQHFEATLFLGDKFIKFSGSLNKEALQILFSGFVDDKSYDTVIISKTENK